MATKKTSSKKTATKKKAPKITIKEYCKARNIDNGTAGIITNFIRTQRGVSFPKTAKKSIAEWDKTVNEMNSEKA